MISKEERAKHEKEIYNTGLDRRKYNQKLGHAQSGYAEDRKKQAVADILKKGKGKNILELGSTSWKHFVDFENYPPENLVCINISEKELKKGMHAAQKLNTERYCSHTFKLMDAHKLDFPDHSFDIVFGTGILHHLEFEVAIKEIHRVLDKDKGMMVFVEPLGRNPVAKLVRKLTPNARTPDEKPLDKEQFQILERYFTMENSYYQFFYVPMGVLTKYIFKSPYNPLTHMADRLDMLLEKTFKNTNLCLYFRIVIIYGIPR